MTQANNHLTPQPIELRKQHIKATSTTFVARRDECYKLTNTTHPIDLICPFTIHCRYGNVFCPIGSFTKLWKKPVAISDLLFFWDIFWGFWSHFPTPTPQTNQPTFPVPPFGHSHLLPVSEARHPDPELAHEKNSWAFWEGNHRENYLQKYEHDEHIENLKIPRKNTTSMCHNHCLQSHLMSCALWISVAPAVGFLPLSIAPLTLAINAKCHCCTLADPRGSWRSEKCGECTHTKKEWSLEQGVYTV